MTEGIDRERTTGEIRGKIQLDTGREEILSDLRGLENQIKELSAQLSTEKGQQSDLIKSVFEKLTEGLKELKQETLNKLREEESRLADLRKTLAQIDSKQDQQLEKQAEILRTTERLQEEFIFEERILPGVREIIKARDNTIGQLNDLKDGSDRAIFLEALDTNLEKTLKEFGIDEVEPENGKKFEPELQEAVKEEETLESRQDKKVLEVLKPGYSWGNRLIRPQQVKVAVFTGGSNDEEQ
ncbi:nucleotide exchange factor GrpE [Candidatus Bipolaricaulota bacterium]|nr:nucleotide exchange factor GrpE [Candidatus Bipolaricaulota bacterium]